MMFVRKWNKKIIIKFLLAAMLLTALGPGCTIQGYIAKKILTSVGKKAYHEIKDHDEDQKEAKAKEKKNKHVRDEEQE